MRLSQMLFVTLREDPAEAEIPSHKLLLRAGYIRRIASGVYAYLPLMWRVLKKVSNIVREEMDATGAKNACCHNCNQRSYGKSQDGGRLTPRQKGLCLPSPIARNEKWDWDRLTKR